MSSFTPYSVGEEREWRAKLRVKGPTKDAKRAVRTARRRGIESMWKMTEHLHACGLPFKIERRRRSKRTGKKYTPGVEAAVPPSPCASRS
jgi:hypothetical protein